MFENVSRDLSLAVEQLQRLVTSSEESEALSDTVSKMKGRLQSHKPVQLEYTQMRLLPSTVELSLGDQIDARMLYDEALEYNGRGEPRYFLARKPLDILRIFRKIPDQVLEHELVRRPLLIQSGIDIGGLPVDLYMVGVEDHEVVPDVTMDAF